MEGAAIGDRLLQVRAQIRDACVAAGRDPRDVTLIAVSKRQSAAAVRAAYACGQRDFGENYVQELLAKHDELKELKDLRWHLIGHLQRNKVKSLFEIQNLEIASIDNLRLAAEVDKLAEKREAPLPIWLQVNVGDETQKSGCAVADVPALVSTLRANPRLLLRGLMTIPPAVDDPEQSRLDFRTLRALAQHHQLPGLSMGMSNDYRVAIEEGATHIRVGTAIFGARL